MKKLLILFTLPIFLGSCSVLVFSKGMAKVNSYESIRLDEKLNSLTSKREVIVELGPADEKKYEDGLEFWYYMDKTSDLIPGRSSVQINVDDDVAKGNSNYTPAMLRETQETIMFIFDGEKVLRYKTENIDLSLQTNSLRAEQALKWQRSTALAFLLDTISLSFGLFIASFY